ncbi:peptide ABC transporter substrate-binding protein [Clostridium sardiniense]|uniref:peptide ABC transporter substrate-binding protein n=1 Tax=Clostridium sardiniense TaxID=29369 RepID=UPI0019564FBE|nr:peptide ABC transporter substrate-binding protein [Clostridium sardiniense]MBM7834124.1 oligopeptide transport system substrate-binding protein [Clostridium sardiniense]MDQ0461840.1 oligopeptide transport system substrate-binding protein [Clostridium sardiniense]
MKLSKIKKLCAVALAISLSASVFVGCGGSDKGGSSAEQKLTYNIGAVVETIDPALNTAVDGSTVIGNAFEGLVRLDENDKAIPGVAKEWKISDDGLTYTFTLRDDAKWSDGQPVTAKDFEYAWKRVLNKKTAAEYVYQFWYIKNAEEYYNGKAEEKDLGIKVVDDKTLEVTLNAPTPYFIELMAFPTYMPVRKDVVEANGDKWSLKPETYISNGPFKLTDYQMKDSYTFEKNENYWNKDDIKLEQLVYKMATDETSSYASLESGNFDMISNVPVERIEDGKEKGLVQVFPNLGTYFVCANVGNNSDKLDKEVQKALGNKKVRQALSLAIDRETIVKDVTKAEQVPSASFVPSGVKDPDGKEFKNNKFDPLKLEDNIAEAKKLLKEAGYEDGKGLPQLELMYNSEGGHKAIMEVIEQNWKAIGVNVKLTNQEWAVFLNTRQNGDYQIARHGWSADYTDPMTFLDMWVSGNADDKNSWGNNDAHFSNKEYDELIKKAKIESDNKKRFEYMKKAEEILLEEMPIMPIYDYTKVYGVQSYVKGFRASTLGQVYFDKAYIEAH